MRQEINSLVAEPCRAAIKGWKVSTTRAIQKGCLIGGAAPLLVHQTLANRDEVLVCAFCHRFVGTEATQLAMLEGLVLQGGNTAFGDKIVTNHILGNKITRKQKRLRTELSLCRGSVGGSGSGGGGGGDGIENRANVVRHRSRTVGGNDRRSRRLAVASALPSDLPDLPRLGAEKPIDGQIGEERNGGSKRSHDDGDRSSRGGVESAVAGREMEKGRVYRCEQGAPCEDVYCSARCRREALEAGHGLICVGGSGEGSPLFEFRRYAVRTSETYFIAAEAVARALSSAEGARPLEALAGWDDPLPLVKYRDGDARNTAAITADAARNAAAASSDGDGGGTSRGVEDGMVEVSVPFEEAQEAWSMLSAGMAMAVAHGRHTRFQHASCGRTARSLSERDEDRALTLEFFLRTVRALGRHLAPIAVPSPLVSYCTRLMQAADRDTKLRALPWLSPAIERASLDHDNGGGGGGGAAAAAASSRGLSGVGVLSGSRTAPDNGEGDSTKGTRRSNTSGVEGEDGLELAGAPGKEVEDGDARDLVVERGLCRLVQAVTSAATEEGSGAHSAFPPLSVVGLLPPCCSPDHSCVPNVQLEATLLNDSQEEERDKPASNSGQGYPRNQASSSGVEASALRVGLIALRGVRTGEALTAPYVALDQSVQERRRELLSCECPRCLLEANGDQSCGSNMLKVLADQALEEGRHSAALRGYRSALAPALRSASPSTSSLSPLERGDAFYGVGVALLAAGKFWAARRAWERGFREAPRHPALELQARKEEAYRPKDTSVAAGPFAVWLTRDSPASGLTMEAVAEGGEGLVNGGGCLCPGYDGFASTPGGAADIFMSKAPVLSREECADVIRAAGAFAKANGGWTTSRHYSVPTTDLPMHVLDAVMPWFRALLSERLFPALAEHFHLKDGARAVAVHDAFVVRYEEGKQRHLPLHRDQSTHSFTIALNGPGEYSGGGTFFPCLDRALRPLEGHVLAFRGGILHGGDPLLKGVRYIIACFCYHDDHDHFVEEGKDEYPDSISLASKARIVGGGRVTVGAGARSNEAANDLGDGQGAPLSVGVPSESRRKEEGKGKLEFSSDQAFSFSFSFG